MTYPKFLFAFPRLIHRDSAIRNYVLKMNLYLHIVYRIEFM